MNRRLIYLSALLLASCASMSPADLRGSGTRATATSKQVPVAVARCITHNLEAMTFGIGVRLLVQMRPTSGDTFEVIGFGNHEQGALAVADVSPSAHGSSIVTYRNTDSLMYGVGRLARMAEDC